MEQRRTANSAVTDTQVSLRAVSEHDETFLQKLYADTRAGELDRVDWSSAKKAAFLAQQYAAQKTSYSSSYPDSQHQLILLNGCAVGRLWVACEEDQLRLLDLALLRPYLHQGIEQILMRQLQQQALKLQRPLRVNLPHEYVWFRSLLVELGFRLILLQPERTLMEWQPRQPSLPAIRSV